MRVELKASRVLKRCSNQLSYESGRAYYRNLLLELSTLRRSNSYFRFGDTEDIPDIEDNPDVEDIVYLNEIVYAKHLSTKK
mgnify:CR=1 FL=1